MIVKEIALEDDIDGLVLEINNAAWDEANEISSYDVDCLRRYLERQDTIFLACHEESDNCAVLMGIASSRIEIKPYGSEFWLYVDEVDVCANQRERGAGKLIMQALITLAEERGCSEVWLGAETGNGPANALYRSLEPDEVANVTGYTYETDV